jgi:sec-independent protein translocase protein TatB
MFDIGLSELLLIAVVALVVLDPKDLPVLMRKIGAFTAKARATVASFQTMLESAGLEDERKERQQELRNIQASTIEAAKQGDATMLPNATSQPEQQKNFINS